VTSGRQKLLAAAVLVGVFLLGGVAGAFAFGFHAHRHLLSLFEGTPEQVDTRVTLQLLTRALHLTDAERRDVRAALERNAAEHTRLRETIEPQLTQLRAKEREEIRGVLTPDQQQRLDKVLDRLDERRGRMRRLLDH
jgi:hypothetical protein